jgi:pyruvate dehydrogenase (quinone)
MAERLVADLILERLTEWGVERVFGYSGDGTNPLMEAFRRRGDAGPRFLQARHEEYAAFLAVGHAKYTGGVGVVTSTQGPGAIHLLAGLYDAKLDGAPVVAIVGQQKRSVLGAEYLQEVDLQTLFKDVAGAFVQTAMVAEQVPMVLDRAFRAALASRAPAVVIVPHDVQQEAAPELPQEHGIVVTSVEWSRPVVQPREGQLRRAAELLSSCERPLLFVGQGAAGARAEVVAAAERLGAGIVTSLLGKPFVDETLPFAAGTMGHLGTTASAELLGECDALLIVGSNDPWTEFYPAPGQARAVQIDLDGSVIGNRYPIEVGLVGDAAPTLAALTGLLPEAPERPWRRRVPEAVENWRTIRGERAATAAEPVNPERVVAELSRVLPDDARVAVDVGSCTYWYARQLVLPQRVDAHVSGTLACMGCGIPYGLAAKFATPGRPVVVLAGDGAMQMGGVAELITVAKYWREWPDPRFVVCVFNNGDLAEVTWEQREMEGQPRFEASQSLPDVPFAGYAELLGLRGVRVEDPERLADAWAEAFAADRPTVIDVRTDPATPILPPLAFEEHEIIRGALRQEGETGARAIALLDAYAGHEERLRR